MGETTGISWTQRTWNPWRGCTKVSPGCAHCYMFRDQKRYGRDPSKVVRTLTWGDPIKWNRLAAVAGKRELVFTCSWSDFFHEAADEWRPEAWEVIKATPMIEYQILTKRPERIVDNLPLDWGPGYPNVWLGTSVETQKYAALRIPELLSAPAKVHFVSCEPLLGPLNLHGVLGEFLVDQPAFHEDGEGNLFEIPRVHARKGLDWVICGGESGPDFRPMMTQWAIDIKAQCDAAGVPFFGKQRSGTKNELPLLINGREWKAFPAGFVAKTGLGQQTLLAEGTAP
jgi:protein gp37